MLLKSSSSWTVYFIIILSSTISGYLGIVSLEPNSDAIPICSIIAVSILLVDYYAYIKICTERFSIFGIFLAIFILFHFGVFILYSLGVNYNYFYLLSYGSDVVQKTILMQFLCTEGLFISIIFSPGILPFKFSFVNQRSTYAIHELARILMIATGLLAYVLIVIKLYVFFQGYYQGVRNFEAKVPRLISLVEYMFFPCSLLCYLYSDDKKEEKRINAIVLIWSAATAFCGDRTTGIAGILTLIIADKKYKKADRKQTYISTLLVLLAIVVFVSFIRTYREGNGFNYNGILYTISDVLGELGSSFFPVVLIMEVCPSYHPFLMGKSYFFSILTGFIPESIDISGTITQWLKFVDEPLYWIKDDYDYTFGTGYSLCAEAYANFGLYGWLILIIIGIILIKLFKAEEFNKFSQYSSLAMLFELFTLPRRNFYYILNHSFYCIIVIEILILLIIKKEKNLS